MNVGKAAGDSHSLQHPDLPVLSLLESIACVSFSWRLLTQRFFICVQQAQTSIESPADDDQLLFSCEEDSRLDALSLTLSASASEP